MKDIRGVVYALLAADASIAAIVTAGGITRIYPGVMPQGITSPSVVQNLITEGADYHMLGDSGLIVARVQIDCWALTPDAAVSLAAMVFDRLSGFSGILAYGSNSPQDSIVIRGVFHNTGRDDYDSVAKMHTRRRDYLIWYGDR